MGGFIELYKIGLWAVFAGGLAIFLMAASPLQNPSIFGAGADADGTAFVVESVPGTAATATGTDALGVNADAGGVDSIAIGRGANASADDGLAIGHASLASTSINTIAIGDNTDATGANCIAIGGNATDADSADCSAADSIAIGQHILADDVGEFIFGSGEFSTQSDAHTSLYVMRIQTTDGTETEVFSDGSSGDITIPSECTVVVVATAVGRQTNADAGGGYQSKGVFNNESGTVAIIGSVTDTLIGEDVGAWGLTMTADDTNRWGQCSNHRRGER